MRQFLIAIVVFFGLITPSHAQNADIEATIGAQIEAFKADDFDQAFTYASPNIQGIFGTPDNFGVMVRRGYPMVWRPAEVRFLELGEVGGALWQKVMIVDGEGSVHLLAYEMIQLENGWKINGVQLLKDEAQSA
ncbi:MAG: DUF4864 domain-containing protein [Paracoccaceae bacterium]